MRSRLRLALLAVPAVAFCSVTVGPAPASAASVASVTGADAACVVEDAAITWGFKESFRSYVSGSIANGEWSVSGGAEYETPDFHFVGGTGVLDNRAAAGTIEFPGAITFTGHGGILSTTIANPVIEFRDGGVLLFADVSGTTQDGAEVDQQAVEFVSLDVAEASGNERSTDSLAITGIPATLTDAGAAAFGTYRAGEPFDPVTLELTFDGDCTIPADKAAWVPWTVGGVVLAAGIGAALVLFRRVRMTPPPLAAAMAGAGSTPPVRRRPGRRHR